VGVTLAIFGLPLKATFFKQPVVEKHSAVLSRVTEHKTLRPVFVGFSK
jgi:hypothetical protein